MGATSPFLTLSVVPVRPEINTVMVVTFLIIVIVHFHCKSLHFLFPQINIKCLLCIPHKAEDH